MDNEKLSKFRRAVLRIKFAHTKAIKAPEPSEDRRRSSTERAKLAWILSSLLEALEAIETAEISTQRQNALSALLEDIARLALDEENGLGGEEESLQFLHEEALSLISPIATPLRNREIGALSADLIGLTRTLREMQSSVAEKLLTFETTEKKRREALAQLSKEVEAGLGQIKASIGASRKTVDQAK